MDSTVLSISADAINDSTTIGRQLLTAAGKAAVLGLLGSGLADGYYLRGDGTWVDLAGATNTAISNEAIARASADSTLTTSINTINTTLATLSPSLVPTAVKTANYTAAVSDFVPVDTTSGNVTITLPTAPADKSRIAVKHVIQGGTNTVSINCGGSDLFNKSGGSSSISLSLVNQAVTLQYSASPALWYVISDDMPLGSLDARYARLTASNAFTGTQSLTPSAATTHTLVINNSALNVSGSSSQGYHLKIPAIINNGGVTRPPFGITSTETLDANSNIDYVVYLGHNFSPTGRADATQAAVGIGFEQFWMNQMEHHVSVGIWPDGTMCRAASVVYPYGTKEPLWYHLGTQHDFYTQTSNALGRPQFATVSCLGDGQYSTFYLKNYDVATATNWGITMSMGPNASGLNENVISATGTTSTNGNLQINATGQLKLQQNLINVVGTVGSQLITLNSDIKSSSNAYGWKSNVVLKTNYNVLLDTDGYIGWGNQGSSNWPAVARLAVFNGTNNLTLENRATSGTFLLGNQSSGNTAGTVQIQNKGVVVVTVNANNTVTLNGTLTAGGLTTNAIQLGTNGPLIYPGSGAPSISAAIKGSLYLRTDGSSSTTRLYVATDTVGGWTAVNTVA